MPKTIWVVLDQQPGHGAGYTRFSRFDVGLTPGIPAEWATGLYEQVSAAHNGLRPATADDFHAHGLDVPPALRRSPRAPQTEEPRAQGKPARGESLKKK